MPSFGSDREVVNPLPYITDLACDYVVGEAPNATEEAHWLVSFSSVLAFASATPDAFAKSERANSTANGVFFRLQSGKNNMY